MDLDPIQHYRPAPQFEQEQITLAPSDAREDVHDLAAMAIQLDQMKIDAAIDAERTRPGLNGFFALVLGAGVSYAAAYLVQYQSGTLDALTHGEGYLDIRRGAIALGIALVAGVLVGIWSSVVTRRTQAAVQAYERRLRALGGTPLPERGQPFR